MSDPPPLDPIVSLAVSLAETPGSCALFLGSGVSVDAGIPTGWRVYLEGLQDLRTQVTEDAERIDDDALLAWRDGAGFEHLNYSSLLERIAADQPARRRYLAQYFDGKEPGESHKLVAALVAAGYVKVIVTTNFDRLLEKALEEAGVDPVVVSDDATLVSAPAREHASCYILKVHGDYQQDTIRNIPDELAQLEPKVTQELQNIVDRHRVVVIGYSGADRAVADVLEARSPRYGLWWVSLNTPADAARTLIEKTGGRAVIRPGAAAFLRELRGRLALYRSHPHGHTPGSVHAEVLDLLRRGDEVGLGETLRREREAYRSGLLGWTETHRMAVDKAAAGTELLPLFERRLASILPVAIYRPDALAYELDDLSDVVLQQEYRDGGDWLYPAQWAAWWIGYITGAALVRVSLWEPLRLLLTAERRDRYGTVERLLAHHGSSGWEISEARQRSKGRQGPRWTWDLLVAEVAESEWLRAALPEIYGRRGDPAAALAEFDFIRTSVTALTDGVTWLVCHYTLEAEAAKRIAMRLHQLGTTTNPIATAVPPDGDKTISDRLEAIYDDVDRRMFAGSYPDWRTPLAILEKGTP